MGLAGKIPSCTACVHGVAPVTDTCMSASSSLSFMPGCWGFVRAGAQRYWAAWPGANKPRIIKQTCSMRMCRAPLVLWARRGDGGCMPSQVGSEAQGGPVSVNAPAGGALG